jgi:hypothetical protein
MHSDPRRIRPIVFFRGDIGFPGSRPPASRNGAILRRLAAFVPRHSELAHFAVEVRTVKAQSLGSVAHVALRSLEHMTDVLDLEAASRLGEFEIRIDPRCRTTAC